ncbi:MAG: hypothetical protein Q4G68_04570 [Planctomycetia bacterium]|nr:hypothetical protein [Planctomycetia bacterium]
MKFFIIQETSALCMFFIALIAMGCNARPAEVPSLTPCVIEIVRDNKPVVGASVSLGGDYSFAINGTTDSNGKAVMQTTLGTWTGPGIPEGTFSVTVVKEPVWPDELSTAQYEALSWPERDDYNVRRTAAFAKLPREFPVEYSSSATTPLKLECKNGESVAVRFDLADVKR